MAESVPKTEEDKTQKLNPGKKNLFSLSAASNNSSGFGLTFI